MKFKGGILYYSLVVIVLTGSFVGFVLLLSYYDNRLFLNKFNQDRIRRNVISAINIYLAGEDIFKQEDTITITLFDSPSDRVYMSRKKWGNYFVIKSSANWKNLSFSKQCLVASDINFQEPIALFLQDNGSILSLSGNTILKGTCYLPEKTVRSASIEGQQFIHKKLVSGIIKESPKTFPELDEYLFEYTIDYVEDIENQSDSIVNILELDNKVYSNSFFSKTIFLYNDTMNKLANYNLTGNIVLWSTRGIELDSTSQMTDIILIAPSIKIKKGFKGEIQAFAIQSIIVEENCNLYYPSQLCVLQSDKSRYNPADSLIISIDENSYVKGGILIKSAGLTSYIKLENGARAVGQIYCPGLVELKGEIEGTLYCQSFYLGTLKARYYNHLLNTRIDYNGLSKHFGYIDLFKENPHKTIIKWL